jgi:hypothetical protein
MVVQQGQHLDADQPAKKILFIRLISMFVIDFFLENSNFLHPYL